MRHEWPEELRAECKRLYIDEGKSASETARAMGRGITRNAVVGQAHRHGWTKGHRLSPSAPKRAATFKPSKPKPFSKAAVTFGRTRPPASEKDLASLRAKQAAVGKKAMMQALQSANDNSVPLVGRRFSQCAWPVGEADKPEFQLCCGRPMHEGLVGVPYCLDHARLAMQRDPLAPKRVSDLERGRFAA
ncbi:MAG: GcrA family cell cycle regulator [Brevundimonas sp.]|uniref:GcrA family cell cycle regulator n=1 Tax=Brevundimonas sp. TaxID=1871086 RepID=UPI0030011BEF